MSPPSAAGPPLPPSGPWPLPLPFPATSRSSMRSRPASFSPSSSEIRVTPRAGGAVSGVFPPRRGEGAPAGGDEHHLVVLHDQHRADDRAVSLRGLDGDHPLPAAAVARILGDRRALAVALLRRGEHRAR